MKFPRQTGKSTLVQMLSAQAHPALYLTMDNIATLVSVQQDPEVQAIASVAMAAEQFNAIGRTSFPHEAFIEIQTAYETAVGNALASADADVAAELQAGAAQIQAILDRP